MPTSIATSKSFTTSVLLLYYFFTTVPTSTATSKSFTTSVLLLYFTYLKGLKGVVEREGRKRHARRTVLLTLLTYRERAREREREKGKEPTC